MRSFIVRFVLVIAVAVFGAGSAQAFNLKKAIKDVGKVVKSVPKIATSIPSPLTTQIDIITGKTKPKDVATNEGEKLKTLANEVRNADNVVQGNIGDAAQAVGGRFGRIVVDLTSAGSRIQKEFVLSGTSAAVSILQGQDPMLAIAALYAIGIRDAHNNYESSAKPLHDGFKKLLAPFVPASILDRARYSVDNLRITAPALSNNWLKATDNANWAMTVDDIIVFIREPDPNNPRDVEWVAHELHHVRQYAEWGIDNFALNYVRNKPLVEAEAKQAAAVIYDLVMRAGDGNPKGVEMVASDVGVTRVQAIATPLGNTQIRVPDMATAMPHAVDILLRCVVRGENVFINSNNEVISPMQFHKVVGKRVLTGGPACLFEMVGGKATYCVTNPHSAVVIRDGPMSLTVGQCVFCRGGNC